jgi:hypothetical protein
MYHNALSMHRHKVSGAIASFLLNKELTQGCRVLANFHTMFVLPSDGFDVLGDWNDLDAIVDKKQLEVAETDRALGKGNYCLQLASDREKCLHTHIRLLFPCNTTATGHPCSANMLYHCEVEDGAYSPSVDVGYSNVIDNVSTIQIMATATSANMYVCNIRPLSNGDSVRLLDDLRNIFKANGHIRRK